MTRMARFHCEAPRHDDSMTRPPRQWIRVALGLALGLGCASIAASAQAAPVWIGDFETNDLTQWNNALNGSHISVVTSPTIQGTHAAQIQLTNDALWPNGLKRVELHHSPAAGRTAEGASTYFAWSFFLPVTLPTTPSQQIGYWETDQSYHQLMAFQVEGEHVRFITQKPQYKVQWEADGKATPGTWHRIAMHIGWSTNAANGLVEVWFDGTQVLNQTSAQTLADANSAFTQLGLLRGPTDFQDSPIIVLDDAVEGDSLSDVHPDLPTNQGGAGPISSSSGTPASSSAAGPSSGATTASGTGSGTGGAGGQGSSSADSSGCGCHVAERGSDAPLGVAAWVLLGVSARRRRGARRM